MTSSTTGVLTLMTTTNAGEGMMRAQVHAEPVLPKVYRLTVENRSDVDDLNAVLFQQQPVPAGTVTLAWKSRPCPAYTHVTFDWTSDFDFVRGTEWALRPGVHHRATQTVPADVGLLNQVTLTHDAQGYAFGIPQNDVEPGSLFLYEDENVPGPGHPEQGCVGIGMSGDATFVRATAPNTHLEFGTSPQYWLALGPFRTGEVLSTEELLAPQHISFPAHRSTAAATYHGRGWTTVYS